MLKQRLFGALVLVPPLIAAVWFGHPWFTGLIVIAAVIAAREFYGLVILAHSRSARQWALGRWAWTWLGVLYIGGLLSFFIFLRNLENGRFWVLLALLVTFACDTAAFFTGRALGRHRLAPRVSPGKTWEGAVAGFLGAMVASLLLVYLLALPLSYGQALLLGVGIALFAQLGDLLESWLKRRVGVKDSGQLIPGHGGILDRMDSVVLAGVVVYYFVIWSTE